MMAVASRHRVVGQPSDLPGAGTVPRRSRRGRSTREALVEAAEKLIADHGLARVSVSQVARAADQRSRAATHYYFKSLEDLVAAILERRGPGIRRRRAEMMAELELAGRQDEVRSIVEAIVLPVTGMLGSSGAHFRCVAQLYASLAGDQRHWLHPEEAEQLDAWKSRLDGRLSILPERLRHLRVEMVHDLCIMSLAKFESQLEIDPSIDIDFFSRTLIDAATAILAGATSEIDISTYGDGTIPRRSRGERHG